MSERASVESPSLEFETHPTRYRHWSLSVDGPVATLALDVREDAARDYALKLNSYDLGVDIELADAVQRIRFEHPGVAAVTLTSAKPRVFSAGANIMMLRGSSHAAKVNFCKYTNETRIAIEEASRESGIKFLAALNGLCAGGGYELALACDEIVLVDDGSSSVSLPETPLLGVLPGTGGLTRLVDKRGVRRDLADFFSTLAEGVRGRRAVAWRLVDAVYPTSQFEEGVKSRGLALAQGSSRTGGRGVELGPLGAKVSEAGVEYSAVSLLIDRPKRVATLTIAAPTAPVPADIAAMLEEGDRAWPLRAFRELDDALLRLRMGEPEMGTVLIKTTGDPQAMLEMDRVLAESADHWLAREIILLMRRTLKRLDLTARTFFAVIETGSAFAGSLFELALAADRSYMLDDPDGENSVCLSVMNHGWLLMSNGLSRLQTRFLGQPGQAEQFVENAGPFSARQAETEGLVSFAPDEIDWEDEVRLAVEARAAFSPDALTGLEANLRFAGPETMETKIFGRLSAWQNWIFQRPNAVGEKGALQAFGRQGRPEFDWKRT
jgi:benzoyl-CoA-dihydrodiol lyase